MMESKIKVTKVTLKSKKKWLTPSLPPVPSRNSRPASDLLSIASFLQADVIWRTKGTIIFPQESHQKKRYLRRMCGINFLCAQNPEKETREMSIYDTIFKRWLRLAPPYHQRALWGTLKNIFQKLFRSTTSPLYSLVKFFNYI